jgi:phosphopantetheine--protein transferase-like protein
MTDRNYDRLEVQVKRIMESFYTEFVTEDVGLGFGLSTIKAAAENFKDEKALNYYFTNEERAYCRNRIDSLAGRFLAKTAIRKAMKRKIPWKKLNILRSAASQPLINLDPGIENKMFSISITHEEDLVAAAAVSFLEKKVWAIGVDATRISRITTIINYSPKVLERIMTPKEIEEANFWPPAMAEKWTVKEAVSKAIGIGIWHGASLQEIEVLRGIEGLRVNLRDSWLKKAEDSGLRRWKIGIAEDDKFALALVLGGGNN